MENGLDGYQGVSLLDWGITPWTVLVLCLVPILALIVFHRIYPSRQAVWICSIPFILSLAIPWSWSPAWWWSVVALVGASIALIALLDLFSVPHPQFLTMSRMIQQVASLENPHAVQVSIENQSRHRIKLFLREDSTEGDLTVTPEFHLLDLPASKRTKVDFHLTAHRRGEFSLEYIYAKLISKGGFWYRMHDYECSNKLHVYPDIKQIAEFALLARTNRLSQIGVRRTRKIGQDSDFERLRDYQRDDNYRHVDWRSTARRQKLTVRQFQTDQSQRIIFLLDCGRMMTNQYQRLSLLDYALNSVLMLSYVALAQGDSVGMICFSDRIKTYVPPASGKHHMNHLLHAGFNQFPTLVHSRFDEAFLYLSNHCRKRSLVVLVTNVIDQVNSQQIQKYLQNLIGAHLPLLVLLKDHRIFDAADNPSEDSQVLYRSAAAGQLLLWRHQVLQRVRASGTLVLDVFPEEMTAGMINQYLEIKARHLL
jgi:uncharacterized protein (DUF58 family)